MPFASLCRLQTAQCFLWIAAVVAILGSKAGKSEETAPPAQTEIIIPLEDFQRELVIVPRSRALNALKLSPAALRSLCDEELRKQGRSGEVDAKGIVFRASIYKYLPKDVRLTDVASAEVRSITFVPQAELKDLAAKVTGNDDGKARQAIAQLRPLRGRAKHITPLLLPSITYAMFRYEVNRVFEALALLGPHAAEALPVLVQKFKSTDDQQKRDYAWAMQSMGDPAIPVLRQLLCEERNPAACLAASEALVEIGPKGWAVLHGALSDACVEVRTAAAAASGRSYDPAIVEHLIPLLKDTQGEVRQTAARSLTQLAHPTITRKPPAQIGDNAVPALLEMLEEEDANSKKCAMAALGAIRRQPDMVLPRLKPLLGRGGDHYLRNAALMAVGDFGVDAAALVPEVAACLGGDEFETMSALRALAAIGGMPTAMAAPKVAGLAADKDRSIAIAGLEALFAMGPDASGFSPRLITLLNTGDSDCRQLACYVLGAMGPEAKDALPHMVPLLTSAGSMGQLPERTVRSMAAIDQDRAIAVVEAHLRTVAQIGDGFRVKDWRADSLKMLRRIKSHANEISLLADGKNRVQPKKVFPLFVAFRVADWRRLLRPGDTIDRVIAAMGTPDSVGLGSIVYDAQPGSYPEYRPADELILSIKHGKVAEIHTRRP